MENWQIPFRGHYAHSLFSTVKIEARSDQIMKDGTGFFFENSYNTKHCIRVIITNKHVVDIMTKPIDSGRFFVHTLSD